MSESKKIKYLTKTVSFGGKTLTLFSIDGSTWSSRKQELLDIKERQERDKVSFAAVKEENGETRVGVVPKGKEKVIVGISDEEDPIIEEIIEEDVIEVDYALDEERQAKVKRRGRPSMKGLPEKAKPVQAKPLAKKPLKKAIKQKAKKIQKVSPKKRASSKPKMKVVKGKNKAKKKAA